MDLELYKALRDYILDLMKKASLKNYVNYAKSSNSSCGKTMKNDKRNKQKKEPIKAPIKIDKESAQKSLINFRQSLKKIRSHL